MSSFRKRPRDEHEVNGRVSPPAVKRKFQSTTTSSAVASFFTPISQKPPEQITWATIQDSLIVGHYQPNRDDERKIPKRRKIAAFDLDSTLIKPTSGNKFAKDAADWQWWDARVPQSLRQLNANGSQVVIFSNQGGISLSKDSKSLKTDLKRFTEFKAKLTAVLTQLDLPISVYAATQRDQYRKPRGGMWKEMLEYYDLDDDEGPALELSFFVGDAGGRPSDSTTSDKDFSSSDRDFAINLGLKFMTPEEYFLEQPPRSFSRSFEPAAYIENHLQAPPFVHTTQDLVVFCGSPGAGKSTYYWNTLKPIGYERVNQDILKTRDKCLKVAANLLRSGKSVAVDNTNSDPETRAHWVQLAKGLGIPARCILFKADPRLCEHNDAVRALNGPTMNPEGREMLPRMAFSWFAKKFREPTLSEGFEDIVVVEFRFQGTTEQKALWSKYHI